MIDRELQDYYEKYIDMFATDGWKQLEADLVNSEKSYMEDLVNAGSNFQNIQGRIQQIRYFLNLKPTMINAYDMLKEEDRDAL